jgi:tRNA-splicing endonuclease subunit Sen54
VPHLLPRRRTGPGVSIPKRGEKDFEPLQLGINVQERALRESREAMFGALEGFRGGAG